MRSAIFFNGRQGCGAANLALFLTAKPSDGYLSGRPLLEDVFAELIAEWPIIAAIITEQEGSGNLLVREVLRVVGTRECPNIAVLLMKSPCPYDHGSCFGTI